MVLLKSSKGNNVANTDRFERAVGTYASGPVITPICLSFRVNTQFKNKSKVIRTVMPSLESNTTKSSVNEQRPNTINAAIVRLMKARKVMSYRDLEMEVLRQLHMFSPEPRMIKVCGFAVFQPV